MSHFTVMVIGENPEKQLQPYHEYECTGIEDEYVKFVPAEEDLEKEFQDNKKDYKTLDEYASEYYGYEKNKEGIYGRVTNPNAKWDWYQLGGRWTGYLKQNDSSVGCKGSPGLMTEDAKQGYCDQCNKGNIDIKGMVEEAINKASETYDLAHSIIKGEKFEAWGSVSGRIKEISEAREFYGNQPVIKKWRESRKFGFSSSPSDFIIPKDQYLTNASNGMLATFAIVKDGKWIERGEMGWWACVSNEKDENEWAAEFNKAFKELPDETLISIYDCHI